MSSSDIFDVLNIRPKSSSPDGGPPSTVSSGTVVKQNKPQVSGIQRELYSLLGDNTPTVPIRQNNKFKDSLNSTAKPSPWSYVEFEANPYVKLSHWVKGSKELLGSSVEQSSFAKFNQHLTIPSFTNEEFTEFMNESNPDWTFEEVQYLFDLCRKYDMKWFIITDRFSFEGSDRKLDDLKEIFYTVCQRYFLHKDPDNPLIELLNFPKEKELERKKYLKRLLSRTAAEIAEEEALIIESRKFEMAAKRTLQEREAVLQLLDHPHSDKSISQFLTSQGMSQLYANLLNDKNRKRKPDSTIPENPWMKQQQQFAQQRQQIQLQQQAKQGQLLHDQQVQQSLKAKQQQMEVDQSHPKQDELRQIQDVKAEGQKLNKKQKIELQNALRRKQDSEYAEHLLVKFSPDERKALGVITHGEKLAPGVFLRSSKIPTYKPAVQNKVVATLQELGLPIRPAMPSLLVVNEYETLLKKIVTLLELKKQVDKLTAEKQISN